MRRFFSHDNAKQDNDGIIQQNSIQNFIIINEMESKTIYCLKAIKG